jgi:site-specific DNA-adenine methylase
MARKNYGLPYKGSKNKIVKKLFEFFPKGKINFVDLFAGGCAMSHYAFENGYNVIANDINGLPSILYDIMHSDGNPDLFNFVTREEFFKTKNILKKLLYSFGNDCRTYLYSKEIEKEKQAIHEFIVAPNFETYSKIVEVNPLNVMPDYYKGIMFSLIKISSVKNRRLKWREYVRLLTNETKYKNVQSLESSERVQSLERLERVQSLERLGYRYDVGIKYFANPFITYQQDYRYVIDITPDRVLLDSIIYCDIPYLKTNGYSEIHKTKEFNHEEFYEFCLDSKYPIFVSEYYMPDGFTCIGEIEKKCSMSMYSNSKQTVEKLFIQTKFYDWYKKEMGYDD